MRQFTLIEGWRRSHPYDRLEIRGVFRNGVRFLFTHTVEAPTQREIDEAVQKILTTFYGNVSKPKVYVLGNRAIDLEQVCFVEISRDTRSKE